MARQVIKRGGDPQPPKSPTTPAKTPSALAYGDGMSKVEESPLDPSDARALAFQPVGPLDAIVPEWRDPNSSRAETKISEPLPARTTEIESVDGETELATRRGSSTGSSTEPVERVVVTERFVVRRAPAQVHLGGQICRIKVGKLVTSATHNLAVLREQGVVLEPVG